MWRWPACGQLEAARKRGRGRESAVGAGRRRIVQEPREGGGIGGIGGHIEKEPQLVTTAVRLPPRSGRQRASVEGRRSSIGLDDAQEWAVSTWLAGRPLVRREVSTTNGRADTKRLETRADGHVRDGDCALLTVRCAMYGGVAGLSALGTKRRSNSPAPETHDDSVLIKGRLIQR